MKKCHNLNIFHCQGNLYFQGEMVHTDVIVYIIQYVALTGMFLRQFFYCFSATVNVEECQC